VLMLSVERTKAIRVGALGTLTFESGLYAYVGSAQNNLKKRVERHFSKGKREFWHIDYLTNDGDVKILSIFSKEASKIEECRLAKIIGELNRPVEGFGSSDCRCLSHLFKITTSYEEFKALLKGNGLNPWKV